MNQRDLAIGRWRCRQLFRLGTPVNAVRVNAENSDGHEYRKVALALECLRRGESFYTEAEFSNLGRSGRADFVNLDRGVITEILGSEKEESIEEKRKYYPLEIETCKAFHIVMK